VKSPVVDNVGVIGKCWRNGNGDTVMRFLENWKDNDDMVVSRFNEEKRVTGNIGSENGVTGTLVNTALGGEKRDTVNLGRAKREEIFDFWITAVIVTIFT
jgi:hypothetical protein